MRRFPVNDDDSLKIDGVSINEYKKYDIRKLVAYVPQEHLLFARSVKDNILMGKIENAHIDLNYAIKMADFEKDLVFFRRWTRHNCWRIWSNLIWWTKTKVIYCKSFDERCSYFNS